MNIKNIQKWTLAVAIFAFAACKPGFDDVKLTSGDADFTKYIALGNSLTSGYADGGLYLEGQKVAYPNLIAQQMKFVGGGEFKSPFFSEAQKSGSGYMTLKALVNGNPVLDTVKTNLAYRTATEPKLLTKYTDEVNNLGVPSMSVLFSQSPLMSSTAGNMYFERLVPDDKVGAINYMQFSQGRNHTFFSFWLGNIDALGWATSGGNPSGAATLNLTDKTQFSQIYNLFINSLTSNNQKGVVATVPDVTAIPFFNTVTVATINAALAANPNVPATNKKLIIKTGTNEVREATAKDLILLNFNRALLGVNGYGISPLNPLESKYVLDEAEVLKVQDYIISYNNTIKQVAETKGLAFVDAYAVLNGIKDGKEYDGIKFSGAYISGNAFSLDGVHLTPQGNAIIANEFIKAINQKYNSSIPTVSVGHYIGVKFPN